VEKVGVSRSGVLVLGVKIAVIFCAILARDPCIYT
jgi:hypothetical protein